MEAQFKYTLSIARVNPSTPSFNDGRHTHDRVLRARGGGVGCGGFWGLGYTGDGVGENLFDVVGVEAVGTVGHFSGAIENDRGWKGIDAEQDIHSIRKESRGLGPLFRQIRRHERLVFVAIKAEKEHVLFAGKA